MFTSILTAVQRSHNVRAIEMDAASRNLYIVLYNTTARITEMSICNVDSNMCAQIEHNLFDNAYGLALHPQKGYVTQLLLLKEASCLYDFHGN